MTELEKPTPRTLLYLEYNKCAAYIEAKYGISTRDYAGNAAWTTRRQEIIAQVYAEVGEELGLETRLIDAVANRETHFVPLDAETRAKTTGLFRLANPRIKQAVDRELPPEPPHQDFWHWIDEIYESTNGDYFILYREDLDDAEDWQKAIGTLFFDEFAPDADEIQFMAE